LKPERTARRGTAIKPDAREQAPALFVFDASGARRARVGADGAIEVGIGVRIEAGVEAGIEAEIEAEIEAGIVTQLKT